MFAIARAAVTIACRSVSARRCKDFTEDDYHFDPEFPDQKLDHLQEILLLVDLVGT